MSCPETQDALVELVTGLSDYREEGQQLRPRVVICDDLTEARGLLQVSQPLEIGEGPRGVGTLRQALKRAAPLAQRGWAIYIHRSGDLFRYGVFRESLSPTALDLTDAVMDLGGAVKILIATQIGERTVEMAGSSGGRLVARFSGADPTGMSPRESIRAISASAVREVEESIREQLASYLRGLLSAAAKETHGCLIVVALTGEAESLPGSLKEDGVLLNPPIDLAKLVREREEGSLAEADGMLRSYSDLVSGMLQADGIVVMSHSGLLIGYNVFVRSIPDDQAPPRTLVGGARRRAYRTLYQLVDAGEIAGALFQSSDGGFEFKTTP